MIVSVSISQVKVLFVRNLSNGVTEEILEKSFSAFGNLERVKKLKDYAFIHFEERDGAVKVQVPFCFLLEHFHLRPESKDVCTNVSCVSQALEELNGKDLEGDAIQIVFAKPPDQKRKERKAQRQAAKTQM